MIKEDQQQASNNSDEISLKELILKILVWWQYFLYRWKLIVIIGLIGSILGLMYAYHKKPTYTAELSFALQDEKVGGGISGAASIASQFGIDLAGGGSGGEFSGDNLLELIKSRSMVERALLTPVSIYGKTETLAEFYIDINGLRKSWKNKPKLENVHFSPNADRTKFTLQQDSLLGEFYEALVPGSLTVDKTDKKLSIVNMKVISSNELFSKYFTEVLEKGVSDFYIQTKTERASRNVAILQRQVDSIRHVLNSAISGVAISVDVNPNPNPLRQTLRVPSQSRQVDVQANTLILSELVKNLEIAKMTLLQQTPLIQVIDKPILPLKKQKTSKLKGLVTGGMVSGFLILIILFLRKSYKNIMGR